MLTKTGLSSFRRQEPPVPSAQSINRAVAAAAKDLAVAGISVLHAHGPKNTLDLREPADGHVTSAATVDDLGMDSLMAAEIVTRLEEDFDIEFGLDALEELAQVTTVKDLATSVESVLKVESARSKK